MCLSVKALLADADEPARRATSRQIARRVVNKAMNWDLAIKLRFFHSLISGRPYSAEWLDLNAPA